MDHGNQDVCAIVEGVSKSSSERNISMTLNLMTAYALRHRPTWSRLETEMAEIKRCSPDASRRQRDLLDGLIKNLSVSLEWLQICRV